MLNVKIDPTSEKFMFKTLDKDEESKFRTWANSNFEQEHLEKCSVYHPVIRDEYEKMGLITQDGNLPLDFFLDYRI